MEDEVIDVDALLDELNVTGGTSITHASVLIRISRLYREGMSAVELYETTRGVWRVDVARARRSDLAMAVVNQRVLEVYRPSRWAPAGSTPYKFRDQGRLKREGRWEFVGEVAEDEVRQQYVGLSVEDLLPAGAQNPIRYVNIR